jgi:hypothetical protein
MLRSARTWKAAFACLLIAAACFGVASLFTETQAKGPCICPQVYAPVQCDHGKIYPNQCVADCRHAKNCVPLDWI